MTDQNTPADKRSELRDRISRSQADLDRVRTPGATPVETMRAIAIDYPFAVLLGGLAIGVIAGAVIPRAAGRKLVRGAVAAATVAGELGLEYSRQAAEKTGDVAASGRDMIGHVGDVLGDLGGSVADRAALAGQRAAAATGEAAVSARATGLELARKVARLSSQLRH